MQIDRIAPNLYFNRFIKNTPQKETQRPQELSPVTNTITFEARVDKGLVRFYEANATRMPLTVKTFIENLADKASKTPLQAQAAAFGALAGLTTIGAIKDEFDEPLFNDLKDPSESKATRGILGVYRENKELLDLCNQSILESGENLTVWLVKKIFLEGKTVEEINKDFKNEVNKDFNELYIQKEKGEEPIKSSTLKALGIKMPEFEYQQSLRYTRDGYSDLVGDKISQAQKDFYASLPIEERTARARKSVERFENWWNSMSRNEQLDLIAQQLDELEMLQKFNSSDFGKTKNSKKSTNAIPTGVIKTQNPDAKNKIEVNSTLSRDDLFKIWAGNHLKIFKANLTELDKSKIEIKRQQRRAEWWNSMSAQERTDYINKLRTGAEPLRFAMIDAWNKNPDILIELSHTLKKNHFNKPTEALYGSSEFNEFMSSTMTNFWESHPDFAERLGETIKESHNKIKDAINSGKFEYLKRDISNARVKREKEIIDAVKNYRIIFTDEEYDAYPEHVKEFIEAYSNSPDVDVKLLPAKYLKEYFDGVATQLSPEIITSWTKVLKREALTPEDSKNIEKIRNIETIKIAIISRALEATLADILYECTGAPDVYKLSHADCKYAIKQISSGKDKIKFFSHKLEQQFEFPILNRNIDVKKIDKLYDEYLHELPEQAVETFVDQYFEINPIAAKTPREKLDLIDYFQFYIGMYKNSISILFGNTSKHTPEIRAAFAEKFINNMAYDLDRNSFKLKLTTVKDFEKEQEILKATNLMRHKYRFMPKDALNLYNYELSKVLRTVSSREIEQFIKLCCKQKKSSEDVLEVVLLDRSKFSPVHMVFSLCVEQALSDILYENSGNEDVYALSMEELLSCFESLMLIKKFPMKDTWQISCAALARPVDIRVKKRIQPYEIEHHFRNYYNEVVDYVQECINEKKQMTRTDLLYILNPDENKIKTDQFTASRIKNSIYDDIILDSKDFPEGV